MFKVAEKFREDRTRVRDKPRPGRPAEAVTPTMVANSCCFCEQKSQSDIARGN